MIIDLTEAALQDLRSIRDYTLFTWCEEQEQKYLDGIWAKFETMSADPERFRRREKWFPGCRFAVHGKHVILFRIEGKVLQIVRVLHGSMDLGSQLED